MSSPLSSNESDDDMSAETDVDAKHLTALFSASLYASIKNAYAENEFRKLRNTAEWLK